MYYTPRIRFNQALLKHQQEFKVKIFEDTTIQLKLLYPTYIEASRVNFKESF